jgi:hypothetical protein
MILREKIEWLIISFATLFLVFILIFHKIITQSLAPTIFNEDIQRKVCKGIRGIPCELTNYLH